MYYDELISLNSLKYLSFSELFEQDEEYANDVQDQDQQPQQDPNMMGGGMGMDQTMPGGDVIPDGQSNSGEDQEMEALQKYHLINRMRDLEDRLAQYGVVIDELTMLLKFVNFLSYSTILNISKKITEIAMSKLKGQDK